MLEEQYTIVRKFTGISRSSVGTRLRNFVVAGVLGVCGKMNKHHKRRSSAERVCKRLGAGKWGPRTLGLDEP